MRFPRPLRALLISLLLTSLEDGATAQATEVDNLLSKWPYNRPPHIKYWPEDPPHRRRDLEAIQEHIIAGHTPVSVKKMSTDESEKFFPEFWGFDEHDNQFAIPDRIRNKLQIKNENENLKLSANSSYPLSFRPAFALHEAQESSFNSDKAEAKVNSAKKSRRNLAAAPAFLETGVFQCPSGTLPCSTIAPSLCCAQGETCFTIPDSGLGTVGCCPNDATCAGNIKCATGDKPCGSKIGGGCCISGYVCADVGCVIEVTIVSRVTQIFSTSTTAVIIASTSSTLTANSNISPVPTTSTVTNVALQTTTNCACGFQACPLNLGGGCCPTDRLCGPANLCPMTSGTNTVTMPSIRSCNTAVTTANASTPVWRTSGSESLIAATVTSSTPTVADGPCPTGFYACSAYYRGGCCRTGRDCATTDCPSVTSTTLISSGVTIVVMLTGDATTTASGICPTAWYSCAANLGGSCCPNGWTCGVESCTSVGATGTASNPKQGIVQGAGNRIRSDRHWGTSVVVFLVLVMFLRR